MRKCLSFFVSEKSLISYSIITTIFFLLLYSEAKSQCNFFPTVIPDTINICPGSNDTLRTQVYDSYQWYYIDFYGDTTLLVGDTNQYYVVPDTFCGDFFVIVSDSGCTMTSTLSYSCAVGTFYPVLGTTCSGVCTPPGLHGEVTICFGDTLSLVAMWGDTLYQWYKNGIPITGATSKLLSFTSPDSGYFSYQSAYKWCPAWFDGLGRNLILSVINCQTNIIEEIPSEVTISPNPLTSFSTLQISTELKNAEVIIYDILGKEMLRKKLTGNSIEIEKGSLQSGVYFVKLNVGDRHFIQRITVQ